MRIWSVLGLWFRRYIDPTDTVMDLGCGYGEFINSVQCGQKLALDLNPDARKYCRSDVDLLIQRGDWQWACRDCSLDVVFTSNFFEHLPDKDALKRTLGECVRCLKPTGRLIAMGPNLRVLNGEYWDFWDHQLTLSDKSLTEAMNLCGLEVVECHPRFLPYTMVGKREATPALVAIYLRCRWAWRILGKQFLIVARTSR